MPSRLARVSAFANNSATNTGTNNKPHRLRKYKRCMPTKPAVMSRK